MPTPTKPSKYRNKRETVDGINFASKREAARYRELRILERAGQIAELQTQVPFDLHVNGQKVCRYIADFVYLDEDSGKEILVIEDCKGVRTPLYRIKAKMFKAQYGITILET